MYLFEVALLTVDSCRPTIPATFFRFSGLGISHPDQKVPLQFNQAVGNLVQGQSSLFNTSD